MSRSLISVVLYFARANGQSTVGSKVYVTVLMGKCICLLTYVNITCWSVWPAYLRRSPDVVEPASEVAWVWNGRRSQLAIVVGGRWSPLSYSRRLSEQGRAGRRRRKLPGAGIEPFGRQRNIPMEMRDVGTDWVSRVSVLFGAAEATVACSRSMWFWGIKCRHPNRRTYESHSS